MISIKQKCLSFRPMQQTFPFLFHGASQMNNFTYVKAPKWLLQFPVVTSWSYGRRYGSQIQEVSADDWSNVKIWLVSILGS